MFYVSDSTFYNPDSLSYPMELQQAENTLSYEKCVAPDLMTTFGQTDADCSGGTPNKSYQMRVSAYIEENA